MTLQIKPLRVLTLELHSVYPLNVIESLSFELGNKMKKSTRQSAIKAIFSTRPVPNYLTGFGFAGKLN